MPNPASHTGIKILLIFKVTFNLRNHLEKIMRYQFKVEILFTVFFIFNIAVNVLDTNSAWTNIAYAAEKNNKNMGSATSESYMGYSSVTKQATIPAQGCTYEFSAECSEGDYVVSGGYQLPMDPTKSRGEIYVNRSYPKIEKFDGNAISSWVVLACTTGDSTTITAYAICTTVESNNQ
jgi:hypothetical protein